MLGWSRLLRALRGSDGHFDAVGGAGGEQCREEGEGLGGHCSGNVIVAEAGQPFGELLRRDGLQKAEQVESILVADAILGADALADFVELGDDQRGRAAGPPGRRSRSLGLGCRPGRG